MLFYQSINLTNFIIQIRFLLNYFKLYYENMYCLFNQFIDYPYF